ncbi:hypothetical protein F2Q70_00032921 [Brassica cretica]|uniref:Uncharacterized protein n=1 Tax=Brassica cretica TaxID=69181 RepID=A0A8S9FHG2_BRACR|nr:hypothetical protein F2Q70_00032921 [Brassica cretica]
MYILSDPISEAQLQTAFLDAGKASGRRRRVLLPVLCSCLLVLFSYWSRLRVVSYGSCSLVRFEAPHTRSVRLLVTVKSRQTKAPLLTAIIVLPTLILGAAPPCGSTTTGATYPELDPTSTIPISNRCLSPTLVVCLDGLGPVVFSVLAAHQGSYGENPYRKNLLTSPAKPRLRPLRLPLRPSPGVYKRPLSTGFTSPIGCGEADPFSENGDGELLSNKTLICSLLDNLWAWTWLHLVGHSSNLRGSKALSFYWIFISKFRHFRPLLLQHGPNRVPSLTISFLAGLDNFVFASDIEPTLSCPLHFNLLPHLGRETEIGQFAPPLPCAFIPTNWRNTPKSCARRLDRTEILCLIPDACSNTSNQYECDDDMLRFVPVTNYWLRHGSVEVRGFDTIKPFIPSSNSIVLSVLMKAKLAFEIHLVLLRSFVEFRTHLAHFSVKSSQIGLLLIGVAQGPGASHQKLSLGNSPTASYWCINVDFDYQLLLRTIALGIKVKLLHGVLHLAELDSPLIGFISMFRNAFYFRCTVEHAPESSVSVVNFHVPWAFNIRRFKPELGSIDMFCSYLKKSNSKTSNATDGMDWFEVDIGLKQAFLGSLRGEAETNTCPERLKLDGWLSSSLFKEQFPNHLLKY